MPLIGLYVKAELDGVEKIEFPESLDWTLDVQQSNGTDVRERITINGIDEFEVPNSKATANFLVKWEGAKAPSTMNLVTPTRSTGVKELKGKTLGQYTEAGGSQLVAVFECRGMEPVKWYPVGPFNVVSKGGKVFQEADLSDPDGWCEFDQDAELSLMISEVTFEFKPLK
eukprot:TRINITY_DN19878_c0_g1_i2.p1 TRINITY_DN19878_c0_g1~~TRINITY_DN19878_c0_g1_i2.p1  ORF type:complete len:170 (-),score=38.09 TRINITY_DN19878_c0_g1_i2:92-601(-)